MAEQLNIILVPHTHWDREWYLTFQQFRARLVHTIDKLLDILDRDSNFSHFMLDGQTIVLDDYLEVQPEQEARLKQYTRSGRISVGPWYIQPDEFLVSGEALIRNLQMGLRRAAEFGEPMRIGYVPDCFGHIAQLPQILQGFGIHNAVFWRGVGSEARKSEFLWESPDGTRVLVIHLADPMGYSNARMMPLAADEFAKRVELLSAQILPKATTNTLLFMNGSDHLEPQDGLPETIKAANELLAHINPEQEKLLMLFGESSQQGSNEHLDGIQVQIGTLPQYIDTVRRQNGEESEINEANGYKQEGPLQVLSGEMRSGQFSHLLPSVLSTRMWIKQQNNATEHLLEHWVEPLTAWAWKLGAAYPAGLIRVAWKYLLQNHPHDSICGCSVDQVHRENAVRFAQSQQVAESIIAQAMQDIAEMVNTHPPIQTTHTIYQPIPIVVFNPAPERRAEVAEAVISHPGTLRNAVIIDEQGQHIPFTVVNRWRQELGSVQLARESTAAAVMLMGADAPGEFIRMTENTVSMMLGKPEGSYDIIRMHIETSQQPGVAHIEVFVAPRASATPKDHDLLAAEQQILALLQDEDIHSLNVSAIDQVRETIEFVASDLPAYGLKTFWVYPRGLKAEAIPTLSSTITGQEHQIENEWYRVEASADDGSLTITDKRTGAIFTDLNRFIDGGDVGDLYNYCPPAEDTLVSQPIEPPKIELLSAGPVRAILRVSGRWSLPVACTANREERNSHSSVCAIVSDVALSPGVRRIDIHTSLDNRVKDHRLRAIFPVPWRVENVAAEGTFEVRTRPVAAARPADIADWAEEPVNTFPQKRFVDVSDGTIGLAVLNRGLPEYEILLDGPGIGDGQKAQKAEMAVALTLLRCVEWLSRGDLSNRRGHAGPMEHTPEGQCLGHQEFDYAVMPHSGDWQAEEACVLREAQAFNVPVRAIVAPLSQGHKGESTVGNEQLREMLLPSRSTLIEVEPRELVVSAIKRENAGKGLIVRIYNPLSHAVEASIRPVVDASKAFVTNLLEEEQEQFFWNGEAKEPLHVGIRAGEIQTILFQ